MPLECLAWKHELLPQPKIYMRIESLRRTLIDFRLVKFSLNSPCEKTIREACLHRNDVGLTASTGVIGVTKNPPISKLPFR